jgi:3'-5' exonuclease
MKRVRLSSSVSSEEEFVNMVTRDVPSLTDSLLLESTKVFAGFLVNRESDSFCEESSGNVSQSAVLATAIFRRVAAGNTKLKQREDLQKAARDILGDERSVASVFCLSLLLAALTLTVTEENRAISRSAASAIASTLEDSMKRDESFHQTIFEELVYALISFAANMTLESQDSVPYPGRMIDLHIVTTLARAVKVTSVSNLTAAEATAVTVRNALHLNDDANMLVPEPVGDDNGAYKTEVAAALALASQLGPWQVLAPTSLIEVAVQFDLWHAAERICHSATRRHENDVAAIKAVHALIDAAFTARSYRQADTFATRFVEVGGQSRLLDARFLHACDTIAKVIRKRALPVIERQVERVDKAVAQVAGCDLVEDSSSDAVDGAGTSVATASSDIRNFALRQLEENGDMDAAHRLATIWNMEYACDEEAMKAAVAARRKKYLQWNDLLPELPVPELLSTPESLVKAFVKLGQHIAYGFDVEWGDDCTGASLLQIGTRNAVVLVDIPALSMTLEGSDALEQTVGNLFASFSCAVVGFGCRHDLSRLRSSPCARANHWLGETRAVLDLQALADKAFADTSLGHVGLSRCCEHFLLKPLDKAEQCSDWNNRPLSEQQRVYAALDAYVCALIYSNHFAANDDLSSHLDVAQRSHSDLRT